MAPEINVSIIIINYRSAAFTKACLRSIYEKNKSLSLEVIVIDNASYDGCGEVIQAEFPPVRFIQSDQNLGFAGANNLGIRLARGTHLLFLNPDTEIQGDAIEKLFRSFAAVPGAGMVGARLLNTDLSVQTTSITAFPTIANQVLGTDYLRRTFKNSKLWGIGPLFAHHESPVTVDAISGACMMATREVIDTVHGFTTDYFMYAEDLDLCRKVSRAGWQVCYAPDAVIVHHGGRSSESRPESNYAEIMIRESMCQFMKMHRGNTYARLFRITSAVVAACRVAVLSLLLPAAFFTPGMASARRIWTKWANILVWSLGHQKWARSGASIAGDVSRADQC